MPFLGESRHNGLLQLEEIQWESDFFHVSPLYTVYKNPLCPDPPRLPSIVINLATSTNVSRLDRLCTEERAACKAIVTRNLTAKRITSHPRGGGGGQISALLCEWSGVPEGNNRCGAARTDKEQQLGMPRQRDLFVLYLG